MCIQKVLDKKVPSVWETATDVDLQTKELLLHARPRFFPATRLSEYVKTGYWGDRLWGKRKNRRYINSMKAFSPEVIAPIVLLTFATFTLVSCGESRAEGNIAQNAEKTNLVGAFWLHTAYNDPCVLRVDDQYLMYLSKNVDDLYSDGRAEPVCMYRATSRDGLTWTIDLSPVLALGTAFEWDYNKAETPSVVYFNGNYHLYYSGASQYANPVAYSIGHAVSADGISWEKDATNPILSPQSITAQTEVLHVAEPGALVFNNQIYLYFVVTRPREGDLFGNGALMELYLAISSDGYTFSTPQKVLSQTQHYTSFDGYLGYSTPSALIRNDRVELYYDVFKHTDGAINSTEQVALQRAVSEDGVTFTEDPAPLIRREELSWTAREIRGGSELLEAGQVRMWFSGDDYSTSTGTWSGEMAIGMASFE